MTESFTTIAGARGLLSSEGKAIEMLSAEKLMDRWPHIAKVMDMYPELLGHQDPDSFLNMALEGKLQVWEAGDADKVYLVAMTQIVTTAHATILDGFWIGGTKLREYIPALDALLTAFGDTMGVTVHRITGREGWERILADRNFYRVTSTFERAALSAPVHLN